METMDIFSIVLMGAASLLCIALIYFVIKLSKTIANLDNVLKNLNEQLRPITAGLAGITASLSGIADQIKTPLNASINVFLQLKDRVDMILQVEENIRESIVTQISAIVNGIKSFADVYKGNGHVSEYKSVYKL